MLLKGEKNSNNSKWKGRCEHLPQNKVNKQKVIHSHYYITIKRWWKFFN